MIIIPLKFTLNKKNIENMLKFIQKELWRCFFMGKHKKWTLDDKVKIVKDFKKGATISYLNNKYGISGVGTVSRWNKEYDEGRLGVDNRGKRKNQKEIEDIWFEVLKQLYDFFKNYPKQDNPKQDNLKNIRIFALKI